MSLQDIFYLVSIVTMTLLTVLFVVLLVMVFYIRTKIAQLADTLSHPSRIVSSVGEAMVDTAINQVNKFTGGKRTRKGINK